MIKKHEEHV